MKNRRLLYQTYEGPKEKTVTAEAAQGSMPLPDLWNLAYDRLLKLEFPEETILVGYADDVVTLISARSVERAQVKIKQLMLRVGDWFRTHSLSLALPKLEVVILTKKKDGQHYSRLCGWRSDTGDATRVGIYLGVSNGLKNELFCLNLQNGKQGSKGHGFA